jgi:hypothetical protein
MTSTEALDLLIQGKPIDGAELEACRHLVASWTAEQIRTALHGSRGAAPTKGLNRRQRQRYANAVRLLGDLAQEDAVLLEGVAHECRRQRPLGPRVIAALACFARLKQVAALGMATANHTIKDHGRRLQEAFERLVGPSQQIAN